MSAPPRGIAMVLHLHSIPWRKCLLLISGLVVTTYSVIVLLYVQSIPDIGLRAAFDTKVKRFETRYLEEDNGVPKPDEGDRLVRLGDSVVQNWPQIFHALNNLPVFNDVRELEEADKKHWNYARKGEDRFIRVEFERVNSEGSTFFSRWCRVGRLPPEELLPSVLWFFLKLGLFVVGALVYWKRPTDISARQFFLLCIVTFGAYMGGYHWSRIASRPELILVFMICAVLLPPVLLHYYSVFPRPKPYLERHPRWTLLAIYSLPVAFLITMMATYFWVRWLYKVEYQAEVDSALN